MRAPVALAVLAALVTVAGCSGGGGQSCEVPFDASPTGLVVATPAETFAYGGFTSSPNNDCPAGGPVTSVTIDGVQVTPSETGFHLVFCLPRPERIGTAPIPLADTSLVQLIDVNARGGDGCVYGLDHDVPPEGSVTFAGFCQAPGSVYNLSLAASVAGMRSCPTDGGASQPEPVVLELSGTVAVATH